MLLVTEARDAKTIEALTDDLQAHGCPPEHIESVRIDMSPAFIKGVSEQLPNARIINDQVPRCLARQRGRRQFEVWLQLQRAQVLDGSEIAEATDYSLNAWKALTLHIDDGAVAVDNNLIERQIKPWKISAKNWLLVVGSHVIMYLSAAGRCFKRAS